MEAPAEETIAPPPTEETTVAPPAEEAEGNDATGEPPSSKRRKLNTAEKKQLKEQQRKEYWAKKREHEKEAKKAKRQKKIAEIRARGGDPSVELARKRKRKTEDIEFSKTKIVVDCSFDDQMTEKEARKLCNQILHIYGFNMKLENPGWLYVTDYHGRTKDLIGNKQGMENWRGVTLEPKNYLEAFPKQNIVYLTAESDTVLEELNDDDYYVIGGLVDHNRLKGLCHTKATELGLRTARLPIDKFMEMKTRKILTVNHVGEIVLSFSNSKSWETALDDLIPKRKGAILLRGGDEEADDEDAQTAVDAPDVTNPPNPEPNVESNAEPALEGDTGSNPTNAAPVAEQP